LTYNDDMYPGVRQFRLSYQLVAGVTYYLEVRDYYPSNTGAYTVSAVRPGGPAESLALGIWDWTAPKAGGPAGFYVTTSQPVWAATTNQSWLTLSQYSGVDGTWLIAVATPNTTGVTRYGTVTVTTGGVTKTVAVTQPGA
jgi:hypothetical protein